MEVKVKNVNCASEMKSAGFKRKTLVSCILSTLLIICLLISPAAAAVQWKISPSNPVVGDTLKITGTAAPGESVRAEVTYEKTLPVSGGKYQLSLKNIKIPEGSDNLFSVRAEGVQNLHIGVKKLVSFNLNKNATNGVATISQGHVPSWTYDILIDGNAAKGQKSVVLKIKASQTLKADSKGNFAFSYETSSMPAGIFNINIGNSGKTIELRDKSQKKPVADFTAAEVSWKTPLQVKFTDKSTEHPKGWYWEFGDGKSSTEQNPVHTYKKAGRYTISLTVWNAAGKSTIKKTYDIHVKSYMKPPQGHFHR